MLCLAHGLSSKIFFHINQKLFHNTFQLVCEQNGSFVLLPATDVQTAILPPWQRLGILCVWEVKASWFCLGQVTAYVYDITQAWSLFRGISMEEHPDPEEKKLMDQDDTRAPMNENCKWISLCQGMAAQMSLPLIGLVMLHVLVMHKNEWLITALVIAWLQLIMATITLR